MAAHALVWLGTRTARVDLMRRFYQELFEMAPVVDSPGFVVFRLPSGDTVELFAPDEPDHLHFTTGPVAGFLVDDVGASLSRLRQIGAEPVGSPIALEDGGGWAHFRAPDGNVYEVTQVPDHPKRAVGRSDLAPLAPEDHVCDGCGMRYGSVAVGEALDGIGQQPAAFRSALLDLDDDRLRQRPDEATWSALEYACHVRDVYATFTIRLYRTRTEEMPVLEPMMNDLRAARFAYNRRDPVAVLDELADNVEGFCAEAARLPGEAWQRRATRLPGEVRTATWLVRQAMHEGIHHLRDIAAVGFRLGSEAGPGPA